MGHGGWFDPCVFPFLPSFIHTRLLGCQSNRAYLWGTCDRVLLGFSKVLGRGFSFSQTPAGTESHEVHLGRGPQSGPALL